MSRTNHRVTERYLSHGIIIAYHSTYLNTPALILAKRAGIFNLPRTEGWLWWCRDGFPVRKQSPTLSHCIRIPQSSEHFYTLCSGFKKS